MPERVASSCRYPPPVTFHDCLVQTWSVSVQLALALKGVMRTDYSGETHIDDVWADYFEAGRPSGGHHEDTLVRHYLPNATRVGERFHGRVGSAVERDEIIQNGYMGLIEAVRTFDPVKASFLTYATRKIEWKIAESLRREDWLPRERRTNIKHVRAALAKLQHEGTIDPSDKEVATLTGLTVDDVRNAYEDFVTSKVHSLNDLAANSEASDSPIARLTDITATPVDEDGLLPALHSSMFGAIRLLPDKDKEMIALYYYGHHTLAEIGEIYGTSYSRISQRLKRAVTRLRTAVETGAIDHL